MPGETPKPILPHPCCAEHTLHAKANACQYTGGHSTRTVGQIRGIVPHPSDNVGTIGVAALQRIARLIKPLKLRIRSLLELKQGKRVLEVGCGPGGDTTAIAAQVRPGGQVVGIDYDKSMIRRARARTARLGQKRWVTYEVADATALPFDLGSFDVCYSERLIQHTPDAERVVQEMIRVTKPGGTIVVADTDWASLSIDSARVDVERRLVRFVADILCNGYAGRQLWRLLKGAGLLDVTIEAWPVIWTDLQTFRATSFPILDMDRRVVEAGVITKGDLERFYENLAEADRRNAFFASASVMVARGRKSQNRRTSKLGRKCP